MNARFKRLFLKLAISVVTTLLCCGLAELALRLISPVQTFVNPLSSFHRFDAELGWLGVPHRAAKFRKPDFDVMIRTDANGFRKRESAVQPRPGSPVIAVFGDSFVWGWGIEGGKVFTDVIQNELGPAADVRNFGVDAYGTFQELLLLKHCLTNHLRPQHVLVMFYENDYGDNTGNDTRRPWLAVDGTNVTIRNYPVARKDSGAWKKFVKASYFLSAIAYQFDFAKEKRRVTSLAQKTFADNSIAADAQTAEAFCLDQLRQVCDREKIQLKFVYVPAFQDVRAAGPTQTRVVLKSLCDQAGVPLLDLTDDFRKASGTRPGALFFAHDGHWNTDGHALAGKLVADDFKRGMPAANAP
jgi:lysophospholipase L1-like esterase